MKPHFPATAGLLLVLIFGGYHSSVPPQPALPAITPGRAFPGQIVRVTGDNVSNYTLRFQDRIVRPIPTTGATATIAYFQIPRTAAAGQTFELMTATGQPVTPPVAVMVMNPISWPAPRIEDISISQVQPSTDHTMARIQFAISVANVDPVARITMNGLTVGASISKVMTTDYFADQTHGPDGFRYPVCHYALMITNSQEVQFQRSLTFVVTNTDGQSDTRAYALPQYMELDSDGDGLLDEWETQGYPTLPFSGRKIDLRAMGCDPHRKDILVEVDWMDGEQPPDVWSQVANVFADAPVYNPDGTTGIALHVDRGQGTPFTGGGTVLPFHQTVDWESYPYYMDHAVYDDLKRIGFDREREGVFHYCVFGTTTPGGASGSGEIWGDDFFVTLARNPYWKTDNLAVIGTFVHELGHNIGLRHGGIDNGARDRDVTNKPNQISSMNYLYQFSGVPQGYPEVPPHTYSRGGLKPVWSTANVETLYDYDEWGNLKLNFRDPGSQRNLDSQLPPVYSVPCGCAVVVWSARVEGFRDTSNVRFQLLVPNSQTVIDGKCYPSWNCGDSMACVPAGQYYATLLCGTTRFFRGLSDTVYVPNDSSHAQVLSLAPGSMQSVRIIVHPLP